MDVDGYGDCLEPMLRNMAIQCVQKEARWRRRLGFEDSTRGTSFLRALGGLDLDNMLLDSFDHPLDRTIGTSDVSVTMSPIGALMLYTMLFLLA